MTSRSSNKKHDIIQDCIQEYLRKLSPPEADWPSDVRVVMTELQGRLFDANLRIGRVMKRCGIFDHNISSRFAIYAGVPPKSYVVKHRLTLAKQMLRHGRLQDVGIIRIAFAVGYSSHSGFSKVFKHHVGVTPNTFRKRAREN